MRSPTWTRDGAESRHRTDGDDADGFPPAHSTMVALSPDGTAHPDGRPAPARESGFGEPGEESGETSWRHSLAAIARGGWISQLLLVAALAISALRPAVGIPVLVGTLLLIIALVAQWRGHLIPEWIASWVALRRRRRSIRAARSGPNAVGALNVLLPDLAVVATEGTGKQKLGVAYDGAGWVAVLAVYEAQMHPEQGGGKPGPALKHLVEAARPAAAGTKVQVLFHRRGADRQASQSGNGDAGYRAWVAIRMDAVEAGTPVNLGVKGVAVTLRASIRRISAALAEIGLVAEPLDYDDLVAALEVTAETALTAEAAESGSGSQASSNRPRHRQGRRTPTLPAKPIESWHTWSCSGRVHVGLEIPQWDTTVVDELLSATANPATGTNVALSFLVPDGERSAGEQRRPAWLRISHHDVTELEATADELYDGLRRWGIVVHRADGNHAPALLSTVPLGRSPG